MDNQRRRKGTKSLDFGRDSEASDSIKAAAWVWHLHSSTDSNTKQKHQSEAKFITQHNRSQSVSTASLPQPSRFGLEAKFKPVSSSICPTENQGDNKLKQQAAEIATKSDALLRDDKAQQKSIAKLYGLIEEDKPQRKTVTWSYALGDDMIQQKIATKSYAPGNDMFQQKTDAMSGALAGDKLKQQTVIKKSAANIEDDEFKKKCENKNNDADTGKVNDTVWDCGSILYDTFELVSFSDRLDRSLLALPAFDKDDDGNDNDEFIDYTYGHGDYSTLHQSPTLLRTLSLPRSSSSGNLSKCEGFASAVLLDQTPTTAAFSKPKSKPKYQILSKLVKFFRKKSRNKTVSPVSSHANDLTTSTLRNEYSENNNSDMGNYRIKPGFSSRKYVSSDTKDNFNMPKEDQKSFTAKYEVYPSDRLAPIPESPQKLHYHHIHHHHHHYVIKPPLYPNNNGSINGNQDKHKQQIPIIFDAHITSIRPRSESARLSPHTMAKLCTEQNWV